MNDGKDFAARKAKFRAAIFYDRGLSLAGRIVGYEIADHLNRRSGDAWPGQKYLADRLGIAERTVRRAVADLVHAGWFSTEMDGRAWRYLPNYGRITQTPDNLAGVNTGHRQRKHRTLATATPDKKVPLSSLENQIEEPTAVGGHPTKPHTLASIDEVSGHRGRTVVELPDQSDQISQHARRRGAPVFVYENSEPWNAWTSYREKIGLPGRMPTRQKMDKGRYRTGSDCPTLYPPGYGTAGKDGAA
jgi:hypothetical protein